jgi:hypothetical protein
MRKVVESVIAGLITAFILKGLEKYGGINVMKSIYQTFIVELWPIWVGFLVALFYWVIADFIKMHRFTNHLIEWIGFFSYQDDKSGYNNLKGKIKRYIEEELEKESLKRVNIDLEIERKISNLESEIQNIITSAPKVNR